jgi:hypothetical protein
MLQDFHRAHYIESFWLLEDRFCGCVAVSEGAVGSLLGRIGQSWGGRQMRVGRGM